MNFTSHDLSVFEIYGIWKQSKVVSKAKQTQNYWQTNAINWKLSRQIWTPPLCNPPPLPNPPPNVIWSPWPRHVLLMIGHLQVLNVITINIVIVITTIAMIGQLQNLTINIVIAKHHLLSISDQPMLKEEQTKGWCCFDFCFCFWKMGDQIWSLLFAYIGQFPPGQGNWSKYGVFLIFFGALLWPNSLIFQLFSTFLKKFCPLHPKHVFVFRTRARAVWSLGGNGATNHNHHHRQCHQLQTALARVLDELGPKRKHF